jgi:preprotein translocase subunit SecG
VPVCVLCVCVCVMLSLGTRSHSSGIFFAGSNRYLGPARGFSDVASFHKFSFVLWLCVVYFVFFILIGLVVGKQY